MAAHVSVLTVGRPGRILDAPIREYEQRAARYWRLECREVKAEPASRNRPVTEVRRAEAERLRAAAPEAAELIVLTRTGRPWTSQQISAFLSELALRAGQVAFLIGGAFGLDRELIRTARQRLSLSSMTLPHDLARLLLMEQLYRAGTIARGEPYHKA